MSEAPGTNEADESLRRIEAMIAGLDSLPDPAGRQLARGLLEVVLDLHGLALARVAAEITSAPDGPALLARMAEDPHVRAVLLLHGLHPEELAERVRQAVAALNRELAGDGVRLGGVSINGATARVMVRHGVDAPLELRQRIETAVIDAAPELERLVIDGLDAAAEEASPVLAG